MRNLRKVRLARHLSQEAVAVRTGINQATLSKLENGIWPVYPSWSRRLVNLFKVPAAELFADLPEEEVPVTQGEVGGR